MPEDDWSKPPFYPPPAGWAPGDDPSKWSKGNKPPDPERTTPTPNVPAPPSSELEVTGVNGQLRVGPTKIVISHKGALGFLSQGLKGEKEIAIEQISAVQFRKPDRLGNRGYIQFSFVGGQETKKGLTNAVSDENSILFAKKHLAEFERAKDLIETYREQRRNPGSSSVEPSSELNDLERLAELRDKGILTEEEFTAKKRQILGL